MVYYAIYPYKHWHFLILATPKGLSSFYIYSGESLEIYTKDDILMKPYIDLLDKYFKKETLPNVIPLDLIGTLFQLSVWHALMRIPFGETRTYKDIASSTTTPKAYQATGNAIGKNPIMVIIPCHRVIQSSDKIGGFSSDIHLKIDLLNIERGMK
jgi:O-6-methylguanine DNA methyltransferase